MANIKTAKTVSKICFCPRRAENHIHKKKTAHRGPQMSPRNAFKIFMYLRSHALWKW